MRVGDEMAGWLNDEQRQRTGLRDSAAIARDWLSGPFVERIKGDLAALAGRDVDAVVHAARQWVADPAPVAALVEIMIRNARADPFFRPVFSSFVSEVSSGLTLYEEPGIAVSLAVTNPDALAAKKVGRSTGASINFPGHRGVYHFIRSGEATFSLWAAPEHPGRDAQCVRTGRRTLRDGDILTVDGRTESFVIEHVESPMIYLHAIVADPAAPVASEYDWETRRRIGVSGNDERGARIEMMSSLLRVMDRRDAVPTLDRLIESSSFHVRWHIMREILALDAEAARPALQRLAAHDPYLEVRQAARATLDKFFPHTDKAA